MILNRDYFRDFLGIAVAAIVPLFLLKPLQNTPFIDDWVYAWPVEHWLQTGDLQILDNSSSINVGQVLWGTIFCLPFGFSFTALRLSTWTLSVACLFGLYLTLRELGVFRRDSLIGVATLGLNPVYFILSFTFMTDIPFLTALVWFSYALIRAVRQRSDNWLLLAIPRLALVGLAAFTFFSFVGVRDHLEYNSALWQPVNRLLAQGVPASEINGGYLVNGWLQYAHAENARLNEKGYVLVPWVNDSKSNLSRYLVSNSLNPDYLLVEEFLYRRWLGRSGSIYLLERLPEKSSPLK